MINFFKDLKESAKRRVLYKYRQYSVQHSIKYEELMPRFPHIFEQIIQELDNKSLNKCRKVSRKLQEFIDERRYPWLRIVKMQTIPIKNGNTYLHLAIEYGQIEIFEAILTEAANYWREAYQKKLAERNTGTVEDTEILVGKYYKCSCVGGQKRVDQSFVCPKYWVGKCHPAHPIPKALFEMDLKNDRNETPFLLACRRERLDMVKMILELSSELKVDSMIDFNAKTSNSSRMDFHFNWIEGGLEGGWTSLHFACFHRHLKIAMFIIENSVKMKIDLNAKTSNSKSTAFHFACLNDRCLEVAKMIIQNSGVLQINLNSKNNQGRTAYHNACISDSKKISKIIRNSRAVDLNAKDNYSKAGWDYCTLL